MNSKVTIKDVAKRASVSQMTVSRVLNNSSLVSDVTQRRVNEAIEELNYRPNIMARGLAGQTPSFFGFVYRNPSLSYLGELLVSALETCRAKGHFLVVEELISDVRRYTPDVLRKRFIKSGLHGVVVIPPLSGDSRFMSDLAATGIPHVCLEAGPRDTEIPIIGIDERAAARIATTHLIELGHKDIGLISGPHKRSTNSLRVLGFNDALRESRLLLNTVHLAHGDFSFASGKSAMLSILESSPIPSAIFACNDEMAIGAMAAIHSAGLSIPGDISVVGYDDTRNASMAWPPLTTIRQPIRKMAEGAIELLQRKRSNEDIGETDLSFEHQLIIRASTACFK